MSDNSQSALSRHHHRIAWLIAASLLAAGSYLSMIGFLRYEWLSRAGCLIVVTGIWSGLGGLIQERVLAGRLRWRHRNALLRARADLQSRDASPEETAKEIGDIDATFEKRGADLADKLKISLGVQEFSILVTGTVLWGFGDIIVEQLF